MSSNSCCGLQRPRGQQQSQYSIPVLGDREDKAHAHFVRGLSHGPCGQEAHKGCRASGSPSLGPPSAESLAEDVKCFFCVCVFFLSRSSKHTLQQVPTAWAPNGDPKLFNTIHLICSLITKENSRNLRNKT